MTLILSLKVSGECLWQIFGKADDSWLNRPDFLNKYKSINIYRFRFMQLSFPQKTLWCCCLIWRRAAIYWLMCDATHKPTSSMCGCVFLYLVLCVSQNSLHGSLRGGLHNLLDVVVLGLKERTMKWNHNGSSKTINKKKKRKEIIVGFFGLILVLK